MMSAAIGTAAKTYCSEMPIDGERCVAIAGTRAAPCHTRRPQNTATSAPPACRRISRTPTGSDATLWSVWAAAPDDAWAVGGALMHWNGAQWRDLGGAHDAPVP